MSEYPGHHCVIERGVEIGPNTVIKNYVELRSGTRIGESCYIDSRVSTSGDCTIGNKVTVRYSAIIARKCVIGDSTFIAPRVMFENLNHKRQQVGGARVGRNCFIGTGAIIAAGVTICDNVVVGSGSYVTKSITRPGVYVGVPATWRRPLTGDGDGV